VKHHALALLAIVLLVLPRSAIAATPTAQELSQSRQWAAAHFSADTSRSSEPFFSFTFDGKSSAELLPTWKVERASRKLDDQHTERTLTYADPNTGLEIRCVGIEYSDFPAVEWVLYASNTGVKDTAILEDLCALDARFERREPGDFMVNHLRGSDAKPNDFEPLTDVVPPTGEFKLFSHGAPASNESACGNPSDESMPMFDVECGGQGIVAALGWSGPWSATIERDGDRAVRVRAKMDSTHLYLKPGERIRSPRMLLLFWRGDRDHGHNLWRQLILRHYSPTLGGKPFAGLICDANWSNVMDADRHIQEIRWWADHDIPMECYWMDAAWTDMSKGWFAHQSDQTPNKKLFPNGMRPIADAAHERGMKYLLWFVPHSLHAEVGIGKEHPEFLGPAYTTPAFGNTKFYALDHGKPEINRFAIDRFSKIVADFGIDVFRQDGPAGWPADGGPDRVGMSQIRYTEGFYEFWDGLLERNPNLMIDNCATGARRVELETMRRSIALHRSDLPNNPNYSVNVQSFNQGLFPWVPLHGGVTIITTLSPYSFRSAYCPALLIAWPDEGMPPTTWVTDVAKRWEKIDLDLLRRLVKEHIKVRPYIFGDYYALTPYSAATNAWVGWQFDRPDLGEGMVQVFRRPDATGESLHVNPRGLDAGASYVLTNLDTAETTEATGRDLAEKGVAVIINDRPGSAIITYKRKP
jgi:alpha-galactosidase